MFELIFAFFAELFFWIFIEFLGHTVILSIIVITSLSYGLTWMVCALFFDSVFNGYILVAIFVGLTTVRLIMMSQTSGDKS